jgi:type II secretory pathway pseudopilin PulG
MEIGTIWKEGRRWNVEMPSGPQITRTKREAVALVEQAQQRLHEAAREYADRQTRNTHPDGKADKAGRWHPTPAEAQPCCRGIRTPSRAWPWSYMTHCRTIAHLANLYDVNITDLWRASR